MRLTVQLIFLSLVTCIQRKEGSHLGYRRGKRDFARQFLWLMSSLVSDLSILVQRSKSCFSFWATLVATEIHGSCLSSHLNLGLICCDPYRIKSSCLLGGHNLDRGWVKLVRDWRHAIKLRNRPSQIDLPLRCGHRIWRTQTRKNAMKRIDHLLANLHFDLLLKLQKILSTFKKSR